MSDIALTTTQIALVFPDRADVSAMIAGATITAGQPVYVASTGKVSPADGNGSGTTRVRGIALNAAGAGQAVNVLKRGAVYGFTISGLAYDAVVYLSDTVGRIADAPSTTSPVRVGRVVPLSDSDMTKVLYVDCDWLAEPASGLRVFVSAEQTGAGTDANVAHGLGVVPFKTFAVPTDLTPSTAGEYAAVAGTHTTTNCVFNVTDGKKFIVVAWAA